MEPRPPTTWEQKERAGLLALETDAWRQKRHIAEDPNTTADVLERLAREIDLAWSTLVRGLTGSFAENQIENYRFILTAEAVAANPNTPPHVLLLLLRSADPYTVLGGMKMQTPSPVYAASIRGLCRNPIAALICLEKPDFWLLLDDKASEVLLRREALPPQSAGMLARHSNEDVVQAAKYHVSVTGEIQSRDEGRRALTQFWRSYCSSEETNKRIMEENSKESKSYIADLIKWGFVPSWALAGTPRLSTTAFVSPRLTGASPIRPLRRLIFKAVSWTHMNYHSRFLNFVIILQGDHSKLSAYIDGTSPDWMNRLEAVFSLPVSAKPFSKKSGGELPWEYRSNNCSPLDLLNHLAHDGNRLVRWAAQTRLADPNFVFTWHEGE